MKTGIKKIGMTLVVCLVFVSLSFPVKASQTSEVVTGESEEQQDTQWGFASVELYPRLKKVDGQWVCAGATAKGFFPGLFYRTMKVTLEWDVTLTNGDHRTGSTPATVSSTGTWFITNWVEFWDTYPDGEPILDYGEFWAYAYVNGNLKDTAHESYTRESLN